MVFLKTMLSVFLIFYFYLLPVNNEEHKSSGPEPRAYYVSPSGDDLQAGTRNRPFRTIKRINSLILNPGDSILFEGNKDFYGSLQLNSTNSELSGRPITIGSFAIGIASVYAGNGSAIVVNKMKGVVVGNLKLVGSGRKQGNNQNGLSIINSSHIVVEQLDISGFQKAGLQIGFSNNISVDHVVTHENGFAGISVEGEDGFKKSNYNISITHCLAENNPGDPSNLDNHSGNGIVVSNCTNTLIEYCTATNNGWDMPRKGNGPVGIWAFEADSVIIQHCLSYRNKTSNGGADGGGFDFDGGVTHSVIQYCLSFENQGAGYCMFQYLYASPWHDNIFRYNISENDGTVSDAQAGVYIWNSSLDSNQFYNNLFYNNTIYNSKTSAISYSVLSQRKGFSFYNNIFVTRGKFVNGNIGLDIFIANDWWNLAVPAYFKPIDKTRMEAQIDPGFKKSGDHHIVSALNIKNYSHYKLSIRSPLRNTGINLKEAYGLQTGGLDFNGGNPPVKGVGASF